MSSERTFDRAQIAAVVQRVAELSERSDSEGAAADSSNAGISQGQLEQLVAELGMPPALVERAVAELDHVPLTGSNWLGLPRELVQVEQVPGQLTQERLTQVLARLREVSGEVGELVPHGSAWVWRTRPRHGMLRPIEVVITPQRDSFTFELRERFVDVAGAIVSGGMGAGAMLGVFSIIILKALVAKPLLLLLLPVTLIAASILGTGVGWQIARRFGRGRLRELAAVGKRLQLDASRDRR